MTSERLLEAAREAQLRITDGIVLLCSDRRAGGVFDAMNEAVDARRTAATRGSGGDPATPPVPRSRPFELAYILLNLRGPAEPSHTDREFADLFSSPPVVAI